MKPLTAGQCFARTASGGGRLSLTGHAVNPPVIQLRLKDRHLVRGMRFNPVDKTLDISDGDLWIRISLAEFLSFGGDGEQILGSHVVAGYVLRKKRVIRIGRIALESEQALWIPAPSVTVSQLR